MRIAILTNAYPYLPGEQFIEDEIGYWAAHADARVTLLPAVAEGKPRPLPEGIAVDLAMARSGRIRRLGFLLAALGSGLFRRELGYLRRSGKFQPRTVARALLHSSKVLEQSAQLQRYARMHGRIDVAYSYWNETQACAAVLARQRGAVRKVVSRVHGFDLYEARREHGYMPLKRQFVASWDAIFALSHEAATYLQQTYGAPPEKIRISPLGVPLAPALARPSQSGCVHVMSVSFCLRVKRIDRLIDALHLFARRHPDTRVTWTHIGAGPLFDEIRELAQRRLGELENLACTFTGELPNQAVKAYYLDVPVDLLVNTSESEGMPVSIMEAMSAGVPVVAPDVGGISSLVSDRCGVLLGPHPDETDIADAIERVAFGEGHDRLRAHARHTIEAGFDAANNYRALVENVMAIGTPGGTLPEASHAAAYGMRPAARHDF